MSNTENNIAAARLRIAEVVRIVGQMKEDLAGTKELAADLADLAAATDRINTKLSKHGRNLY